jgi:heme A synthase
MGTTQVRIVGVGLSFVLIFLSGIWLSHLGKPYSTGVFTIHKLVGLAVGVLLAVMVYQAHKATPLGLVEIAAIVVTVLFFIGTVAAGGLLSVNLEVPAFVGKLHQVLPILTVLSTAGTLYLLLCGK